MCVMAAAVYFIMYRARALNWAGSRAHNIVCSQTLLSFVRTHKNYLKGYKTIHTHTHICIRIELDAVIRIRTMFIYQGSYRRRRRFIVRQSVFGSSVIIELFIGKLAVHKLLRSMSFHSVVLWLNSAQTNTSIKLRVEQPKFGFCFSLLGLERKLELESTCDAICPTWSLNIIVELGQF